jgi:hypothetical protein
MTDPKSTPPAPDDPPAAHEETRKPKKADDANARRKQDVKNEFEKRKKAPARRHVKH